jgi:hypothetical protein
MWDACFQHGRAQTVGGNIEQTYRRGDAPEKRRDLMDRWAEYAGSAHSELGERNEASGGAGFETEQGT